MLAEYKLDFTAELIELMRFFNLSICSKLSCKNNGL